jgi:competence protein ComEA
MAERLHAPAPTSPLRWLAVGALAGASALGVVWASWSREPIATPPLPEPIRVLDEAPAHTPPTNPPRAEEPAATLAPQPLSPQPPLVVSASTLGPPIPESQLSPPAPLPQSATTTPAQPAPAPERATPPPAKPTPSPQTWATPRRINVNTAPAAELELLPDVGPKLAAEIIAYRQKHGPFKALADLDKVKGVGPKTLAKLEPLIVFEGPAKKR